MGQLDILFTILILIFVTIVFFLYFRSISEIDAECEKAQNLAGRVSMDYGGKLQIQEKEINIVAEKVEVFSSKRKERLSEVANFEHQISIIHSIAEKGFQSRKNLKLSIEALEKNVEQTGETQKLIGKKLEETEVRLKQRIDAINKSSLRNTGTVIKQEMMLPIFIKKNRALAHLTDYQIKILKLLASQGEMTAPQMKTKIGITREHTARLMRRLADEGYVDRDVSKTPYIYRTKEEILELLKE